MTTIGIKWFVITLLFALNLSAGCSDEVPMVKIIVPDNFSGEFSFVENDNGQPLRKVQGVYVYEINGGGQSVFQNLKPFSDWHRLVGEYKSGEVIPWSVSAQGAGEDDMVIDEKYTSSSGETFFLIAPLSVFNSPDEN